MEKSKVKLSNPKTITVREPETLTIDELVIQRIIDSPRRRRVSVMVEHIGDVELWTGDDYDNKGDWTYDDIINELKNKYDI